MSHAFWRNCIKYNLYRVMKMHTLEKLGHDRYNQDPYSDQY